MEITKLLNYNKERNTKIILKYYEIMLLVPKLHSYTRDDIIIFYLLYGRISTLKKIPLEKRFSYIIRIMIKEATKVDISTATLTKCQFLYRTYKSEYTKYSSNFEYDKSLSDNFKDLITLSRIESKRDMYTHMMRGETTIILNQLINKRKFILVNY